MVGVAQSAERLVVVQKVAGSIPVTHPVWIPVNIPKVHRDLLFLLAFLGRKWLRVSHQLHF